MSNYKIISIIQNKSTRHRISVLKAQEHIEGISNKKIHIKKYSFDQLRQYCLKNGEDENRARQLWMWMYKKGININKLTDTIGLQNGFSQTFCNKFKDIISLDSSIELINIYTAIDKTKKIIFNIKETNNKIETVLIPTIINNQIIRYTLCLSCQVGCALNCQFCNTGKMGLHQNLSVEHIIDQVIETCKIVLLLEDNKSLSNTKIKNIVFMGMGEPLRNLDTIITACQILTHPKGLNFSPRKICISTVGLVPEIKKFLLNTNVELAVSLHATTNDVRNKIMPINLKYNIESLISVLEEFFPKELALSSKPRNCVFIEYLMLNNLNDTEDDALRLLELTKNISAKFNLIMFNNIGNVCFEPSSIENVENFRKILKNANKIVTIRNSRGQDEMAACGMLGGKN